MLLLYILLALLGQQTTVNGQQTPFLESENLKTSESEKGCEQQTISNESFLESEKSVNISEICGNEKTNHKLVQKKSEKSCEPRAMSHETFLESENLKNSESEKGCELRAMSHEQRFRKAQSSQLEAQSPSQVFSFSVSQILYFENQIRLADSLYKNYLPQYNFEEVKAAVMFFDSLRLTTDNSQRTTNFLETENLENSESEKGCEQRAMSNEPFLESENLKTSESEKRLKSQGRNAQSSQLEAQSLKKTVDCCPLTVDIEYLRARAHYYHAVGLTERDDIVGACEHYLTALEIMEFETENLRTSKSESILTNGKRLRSKGKEKAHGSQLIAHSPEYEKIRFLALTYNRLGRLFLNENYCDLAILKYRKALDYVELLGNNEYKANILKELGNVYQLMGKSDSALYYYNSSLKANTDLTNKLDLEKNIAQILFDKGEKDSAYIMIKSNLEKLDNYRPIDSYYGILGIFYHEDGVYDSAIYYLGKCSESTNNYVRNASSIRLSAIYDSLGDLEKKAYYDNISSKLLIEKNNKETEHNKIQSVYNGYKERKQERINLANKKKITILLIFTFTVILILSIAATLLRYMYKRRQKYYINSIKEKDECLLTKDIIIKQIESEIKEYHKEIEDNKLINKDKDNLVSLAIECLEMRKKEISDKDKIIKKQQKELANINHANKPSLDIYYDSEICKMILSKKEIEYAPLSTEDLTSLLESANNNLGGIIDTLNLTYPQLNKDDMYLICLILLNINKSGLPYLLNRSRKNIWERTKRIKTIMNIGEKEDIFLFIRTKFIR